MGLGTILVEDKKANGMASKPPNKVPSKAMAISNAMANYGLRKAVSFHNAVKHAAAMIDPNIRNFPADLARFHVSGHQPTGERNAAIAVLTGNGVLVRLDRPEGYEDVHPQLLVEDAIGDRWSNYETLAPNCD